MGSSAVKRLTAALGLCLAGAAVSGLLLLQHHGEGGAVSAVNEVCGDGETSGCEDVARSSWSSFAGLPVAAYGIFFYLSLALASTLALVAPPPPRQALAAAVAAALGLGLLVDLALLLVQALAIHAYCMLCLLTYALSLAALALLLPALRALRGFAPALGGPEGRLAVAGATTGVIALAAAVLAANAALAERAAARQARLLGAPVPAGPATAGEAATPDASPGPAPGAAASEPEEPLAGAAAGKAHPPGQAAGPAGEAGWQKRAQELQATLDDPAKLEAYFTQKAQHQFETAKPAAIDLSDLTPRGPAAAPVKVVEYSDFMCPFCRNLAGALAGFVPQAGGRVAVFFKNFPLDAACNPKLPGSTHPGACNLALGAVCAQRQGRFDAYHDKVFASELRNPQPADVVRLAGEAGLDPAAMQGCLEDPATKAALAGQIEEGNRLGIAATPTLYVNGKRLPRINDFVAVVDQEARKKGFAPMTAR